MIVKIVLMFLFVFIGSSLSLAQNDWRTSAVTRFEQMDYIKADVENLIRENQNLELTYVELKQKAEGLQVILQQYHKEYGPSPIQQPEEKKDQSFQVPLTGQIQHMEDHHRLLTLKAQELRLKLQELQTHWELKKLSGKPEDTLQTMSRDELKDELDILMQRHQEIADRTAQEQQVNMISSSEFSALEHHVQRLEDQVKQLDTKLTFLKKENSIHRDKRDLALKSSEGILSEVQAEREKYAIQLSMLEEQYHALDQKIQAALVRQERKNKLVTKIIAFDKENQVLNDKIDNVRHKIKALEPDVIEASIEAALE